MVISALFFSCVNSPWFPNNQTESRDVSWKIHDNNLNQVTVVSFFIFSYFNCLWESFPAAKQKVGLFFLEKTQVDYLKQVIVTSIFISLVSFTSGFSATEQKIGLLCLDHLSQGTMVQALFYLVWITASFSAPNQQFGFFPPLKGST